MSQLKKVDVIKILNNQDPTKVSAMIQYLENLKRRRVFSIDQQAKIIQTIDTYIKQYLPYNDDISKESLYFYFDIMFQLLERNLIDVDQLSDRDQNPISVFLLDCKKGNYGETKYGVFYIQQLVERGDNRLSEYIYQLCPGLGISEVENVDNYSLESSDDEYD